MKHELEQIIRKFKPPLETTKRWSVKTLIACGVVGISLIASAACEEIERSLYTYIQTRNNDIYLNPPAPSYHQRLQELIPYLRNP